MAEADPERPSTGEDDRDAHGSREVADPSSPRSAVERLANLLADARSDASADESQRLRAERRTLINEKRALSKQIRNETRKRARMLNRSAALSNDDLVEVLAIRQQRAEAKAKAKAAATDRP